MLAWLLCLSPPVSAAAREALAEVQATADLVVFEPNIGYRQLRATVTGPQGFEIVATFDADDTAAVELPGADGFYKYELRFSPDLDPEILELPDGTREAGGGDKATDERTVQRGWFSLAGGAVVPDLFEIEPKVVLTNADGVVRNSLCVGFDCPNSPVFDDSTILMMENNTRIKFGDTSNSPFPNNDWEIEANSSLSGGPNYLGFNDCGSADNDGGCATNLVFAVESGARQSALHVENDGDVGIGTSNPVLDLHIVTGNTPALRLDQDGSSGFTPQIWDIAGNETNFFIRDVNAGSTLPFRIRPGAPSNSVFIETNGDVGLGTSSPTADLDIRGASSSAFKFKPGNANANVVELKNNAGNNMFSIFQTGGGGTQFSMFDGAGGERFRMSTTGGENRMSGDLVLGCNTANADFVINANVNASSVTCGTGTESRINAGATTFTASSSRTIKENLVSVTADDILDKIADVGVYTYDFIEGPKDRLGLMAEDFHTVFGRGSDKLLDGQEVQMALWLAVQELSERNRELTGRLAELEGRLRTQGE